VDLLIDLTSGYGTEPAKVIVASVMAILGFAIVFALFGVDIEERVTDQVQRRFWRGLLSRRVLPTLSRHIFKRWSSTLR
jgi:hypothetical protein